MQKKDKKTRKGVGQKCTSKTKIIGCTPSAGQIAFEPGNIGKRGMTTLNYHGAYTHMANPSLI